LNGCDFSESGPDWDVIITSKSLEVYIWVTFSTISDKKLIQR